MKKILFILPLAFLFSVCSPGYRETKASVLPDELKDCKFYHVTTDNGGQLNIVRCPLSSTSTTYSQGKTQGNVSTVEIPQEELDKQDALNKLTDKEKKLLGF